MAGFLDQLGGAEQKRLDRIKEIENEFERMDRSARWENVEESINALKKQVFERAQKGDFQIIDGQKQMTGVFFPRDCCTEEFFCFTNLSPDNLFTEAEQLIRKGGKECDRLRTLFATIHSKNENGNFYFKKQPGMLPSVVTNKRRQLLFKFGGLDTVREGYIYFEQDSKDRLKAFIKKANDEGISITGFEYRWRGGRYVMLKNLEDRVEYKIKTKEEFDWGRKEERCGFGIHYSVRF